MAIGWWNVWKRTRERFEPKWREDPSCFERHLQRRFRNALFPLERQNITSNDLREARARDDREATEAMERVISAFQRDLAGKTATLQQISDVRDHMARLVLEAARVGGASGREIALAVHKLWNAICEDLNAAIGTTDEQISAIARLRVNNDPLGLYRRFQFFAQMVRPDSPIRPDEIAISLILEHPETLASALDQLTDAKLKRQTIRRAIEAILTAEREKFSIPDVHLKLDVLESHANTLPAA